MSETYPELSAEQNERTCRLIMRGIAKYPQSTESGMIVAHYALGAFTSPDSNAVDLRDIARVEPSEYEDTVTVVHALHEKFGIEARPDKGRIDFQIYDIAKFALLEVYNAAYLSTNRLGQNVPEVMKAIDPYNPPVSEVPSIGYVLHEYLSANDAVRGLVTDTVKDQAQELMSDSYYLHRAPIK